jgi:hypothetical protein
MSTNDERFSALVAAARDRARAAGIHVPEPPPSTPIPGDDEREQEKWLNENGTRMGSGTHSLGGVPLATLYRAGLVRTPTAPVLSEEYVCQTCRTVKNWPLYELGVTEPPPYARLRCDVCTSQSVKATASYTTWAAVRIFPERVRGVPAGTFRPADLSIGLWEDSPDAAAVAAEKARRIATI